MSIIGTIIILLSQVWDLTRYGEQSEELFLKNLDICYNRLKLMQKKVIWITTPLVDDKQHPFLYGLLLKINPLSITKAKEYNFFFLDLNELLKNHMNLHANDGIHWNTKGQRRITQYVIDFLLQLPIQRPANIICEPPPFENTNADTNILSRNGRQRPCHSRTISIQNQCPHPRSTFNHRNDKYASASRNKEDDEVHSKQIKLTVTEAELVGLVVGTAVKTILN